jgi:hypothetical protein
MSCENSYISGNIIVVKANFTDSSGTTVIPISANISIKDSAGVGNTYPMVKTGSYFTYEFNSLGKSGMYYFKIQSDGNIQSSAVGSFNII